MKFYTTIFAIGMALFAGKAAAAAELPLLDRNIPEKLKTATFALG